MCSSDLTNKKLDKILEEIFKNWFIRFEKYKKSKLVIGNEGSGISRLVKSKCDFVVSIPMRGRISSLNASSAAAILMYEIRKQRDAVL